LDHSLPLQSGYTFRTRAILKAQTALGLEVRGITGLRHMAKGPNPEVADDLTFYRTKGHAGGPVLWREWREIGRFAAAIDAVCKEWRPDVIHAHSPALCGMAAMRIAKKRGIPLVYEIRAFWEDAAVDNGTSSEGSVKYQLTRALEEHVVRGADAVITICHGLKDDLVSRGFDPGHFTLMPNGVDLALFGESLQRDAGFAEEIGLGQGPVIGFIGSFYDYEGIDDLITAMPMLAQRHPDARLLLVGGGPMEAALRAQAAASPAADAIRFIGRVPHQEVEKYYALADIMAYPRKKSRLTDTVTPLKPLEAMAQNKLVAASDVGGHRELVRDGVTGTLFAADDPAACALALAELLDDRSIWDVRRAAGREHVAMRHDWAKNAENYLGVYHSLLGIGNKRDMAEAA
jgi:glycogen synthase